MTNPIEADVERREANRTVYTFTVPKKLQGTNDEEQGTMKVETVGLVELRGGEEIEAAERAQNNLVRGNVELVKAAVRWVNGKAVHSYDGSVDKVWNRCDPRVRGLILNAFQRIHTPEKIDTETFLGSVSVS